MNYTEGLERRISELEKDNCVLRKQLAERNIEIADSPADEFIIATHRLTPPRPIRTVDAPCIHCGGGGQYQIPIMVRRCDVEAIERIIEHLNRYFRVGESPAKVMIDALFSALRDRSLRLGNYPRFSDS